MDYVACGALVVLAGLAAAPADEPLLAADEVLATAAPALAVRDVERSPVSFRFVAREEGHEILLTDVHVTIRHSVEGTLVDAVSNGPYLVAFMPAGRYDVAATHDGKLRTMTLTIPRAEARSVALYW